MNLTQRSHQLQLSQRDALALEAELLLSVQLRKESERWCVSHFSEIMCDCCLSFEKSLLLGAEFSGFRDWGIIFVCSFVCFYNQMIFNSLFCDCSVARIAISDEQIYACWGFVWYCIFMVFSLEVFSWKMLTLFHQTWIWGKRCVCNLVICRSEEQNCKGNDVQTLEMGTCEMTVGWDLPGRRGSFAFTHSVHLAETQNHSQGLHRMDESFILHKLVQFKWSQLWLQLT